MNGKLRISLPPCGRLKKTGVGFPGQLGSGKIVSVETSLSKDRMLWMYFKTATSLTPIPSCMGEGIFSNLHHENLIQFPEVKLKKCQVPLGLSPLEVTLKACSY